MKSRPTDPGRSPERPSACKVDASPWRIEMGAHKPTVLVVDDNADTRVVVRWMLERWGCLVVEAADGREALDQAVVHRPDLVVMDLSMPVADGYEAVRSI